MERTHYNGELRLEHVGLEVSLIGWVSKKRNFGQLNFIDLRDRSGICQLLFSEQFSDQIKPVRNEYLLHVHGKVVEKLHQHQQDCPGVEDLVGHAHEHKFATVA